MNSQLWLRHFSKLTCFSTLLLIFVGSLVTSTGSGLAVPDWPLAYGMFFPPMIGGIFYEHGHRIAASLVGFLTLILALWLIFSEKRKWLRYLGLAALASVTLQGILGGLTVMFLLPTSISVSHAVLSQGFFVMTIIIAYSLSKERMRRSQATTHTKKTVLSKQAKISFFVTNLIFLQLIIGAIMRHTDSGLAIPDFPTMGGQWIPLFNNQMISTINDIRFDLELDPVLWRQIVFHFTHRLVGILILVAVGFQLINYFNNKDINSRLTNSFLVFGILVLLQVGLGIGAVRSATEPYLTSVHVVMGAAVLGWSTLLTLRLFPISLTKPERKILIT